MKHLFVILIFWLLLACGGSNETTEASRNESAAVTEARSDDSADVLHQMPDSEQIEDAYEAIMEKAGVDDPELMEVNIDFSKSITGADGDDSYLSVKLVSPQDRNKILYYRYDFPKKAVREPMEVTLTTGLGTTEKFIDTYDGFKRSLFKKADILDFDRADEVYEETMSKSEYGVDKCYVKSMQFMYFPNGLHGRVAVQSTRSPSAYKSFIVDQNGQITPY